MGEGRGPLTEPLFVRCLLRVPRVPSTAGTSAARPDTVPLTEDLGALRECRKQISEAYLEKMMGILVFVSSWTSLECSDRFRLARWTMHEEEPDQPPAASAWLGCSRHKRSEAKWKPFVF